MQVGDENLGVFLVDSGTLSRRALEEATVFAREREEPLVDRLVLGGYLTRDELRRAQAKFLGVPFIELSHELIDDGALFLIPEPLARGRSVIAFRRGEGTVEVALLDLADLEHLDFLRTEHRLDILPRLTTAESIKRALLLYQRRLKEQFGVLARGGMHAAEALLKHALISNASSVHLDLRTVGLLVRYRIKGLLQDAMTLPKEAAELFGRLKEMAKLSPTLHVPQEGAFKVDFGENESTKVRVHSVPAHAGERLTLHLFPHTSERKGFSLESVGLHGASLEAAHKLLHHKHGLVVVAGREGAGKTTLLYTLLDSLRMNHRHVVTVEDEVELTLPYATQLRARPEVGLNTAATLRAALTQDPDVVMVGEVRDREAEELVVSAAARGLLVFAGAASADIFKEGAYIRGVINTALVRRVCPHCKEAYRLSRAEGQPFEGFANFGTVLAHLKEEGVVDKDAQWKDLEFARAGVGCHECSGGYKGFIGLQEVLIQGESPLNLIEDGLFKAAAGITSIEEVVRLVQEGQ